MSPVRRLWRRLLDGWMVLAGHFGEVQTLVLLALFYGLLIGPVSAAAAIARQDMLYKRGLGVAQSAWHEADTAAPDLERAKLQT